MKRATEADRLHERMNANVLSLNGMVSRLSRAVDRISGPVPQGGDAKADSPLPPGHVVAMDVGFNDIEAALSYFRNQLERLEAFV